jgi:YndJ-like protein
LAGVSGVFPALIWHLTLVDLLLLFATLVIVPLGLRLVPFTGPRARRVLCVARIVQPFGALAAVVAFLITPGWTAGAVALGWLITCAVASLAGLMELIDSRSLRPAQLVPAAAVAYLSVGAGWLVLSRAGLQPEGFSHEIVELTGVHFHYAGFAATLMAALTMGAVRDRGRLSTFASGAAMLIVIGVPITAAGIATGSGLLTVAGPVLLGTGVLSIAGITGLAIAPQISLPRSLGAVDREISLPRLRGRAGWGPLAARWLLWISAAGVVVPMLLGVDYAISRVFPIPALDLRAMALIHGDLNALVFSLAGLLGWTLARSSASVSRTT